MLKDLSSIIFKLHNTKYVKVVFKNKFTYMFVLVKFVKTFFFYLTIYDIDLDFGSG